MPRPIYAICAESVSEDKETGLFSLFNIIDKLQGHKVEPSATKRQMMGPPLTHFVIVAEWMRDDGDEHREFDFEVVLRPPRQEEIVAAKGTFKFVHPLFRAKVRVVGQLPVQNEGIMWIESRVRKSGSKGWKIFESPIFVEQIPQSPAEDSPPAPPTPEPTESVA